MGVQSGWQRRDTARRKKGTNGRKYSAASMCSRWLECLWDWPPYSAPPSSVKRGGSTLFCLPEWWWKISEVEAPTCRWAVYLLQHISGILDIPTFQRRQLNGSEVPETLSDYTKNAFLCKAAKLRRHWQFLKPFFCVSLQDPNGFKLSKQFKGSSSIFDLGGVHKKKSCIQHKVHAVFKVLGPMMGREVTGPGVVQQLETVLKW